MANQSIRYWLIDEFISCGATGYTVTGCNGAGRRHLAADSIRSASLDAKEHIRIEFIVPDNVCDTIIDFLRRDILTDHHVTACVESAGVVRVGHFAPADDRVRLSTVGAGHRTPTSARFSQPGDLTNETNHGTPSPTSCQIRSVP